MEVEHAAWQLRYITICAVLTGDCACQWDSANFDPIFRIDTINYPVSKICHFVGDWHFCTNFVQIRSRMRLCKLVKYKEISVYLGYLFLPFSQTYLQVTPMMDCCQIATISMLFHEIAVAEKWQMVRTDFRRKVKLPFWRILNDKID